MYDDEHPAEGKEVYVTDNDITGESDTGYTDSDGEVEFNLETTMSGFPIEVSIYVDSEEFGPYTVDDNESFTVTISE